MLYIHVGPDSLPGPVTEVLGGTDPPTPAVVQQLMGQMKIPPGLQNTAGHAIIEAGLANVIPRTRIALPELDLADLIWNEIRTQTDTRTGPAVKEALTEGAEAWTETLHGEPVTAASLHSAVAILNDSADPVRTPIRNRLGATGTQKGQRSVPSVGSSVL